MTSWIRACWGCRTAQSVAASDTPQCRRAAEQHTGDAQASAAEVQLQKGSAFWGKQLPEAASPNPCSAAAERPQQRAGAGWKSEGCVVGCAAVTTSDRVPSASDAPRIRDSAKPSQGPRVSLDMQVDIPNCPPAKATRRSEGAPAYCQVPRRYRPGSLDSCREDQATSPTNKSGWKCSPLRHSTTDSRLQALLRSPGPSTASTGLVSDSLEAQAAAAAAQAAVTPYADLRLSPGAASGCQDGTFVIVDVAGYSRLSKVVDLKALDDLVCSLHSKFHALCNDYDVQRTRPAGAAANARPFIACATPPTGCLADESARAPTAASYSLQAGASRLMAFAKEVLNASKVLVLPDGQPLPIRIGIHTGSCSSSGQDMVMAGARAGLRRTLMAAASVQLACAPGCIHVSSSTLKLLLSVGSTTSTEWRPTTPDTSTSARGGGRSSEGGVKAFQWVSPDASSDAPYLPHITAGLCPAGAPLAPLARSANLHSHPHPPSLAKLALMHQTQHRSCSSIGLRKSSAGLPVRLALARGCASQGGMGGSSAQGAMRWSSASAGQILSASWGNARASAAAGGSIDSYSWSGAGAPSVAGGSAASCSSGTTSPYVGIIPKASRPAAQLKRADIYASCQAVGQLSLLASGAWSNQGGSSSAGCPAPLGEATVPGGTISM